MTDENHQLAMDGLTIRRYRPEDRSTILDLYHNGLLLGQLNPHDDAADLDSIEASYFGRPGDYFWVADMAGRVIGTIGVLHDEPDVGEIRRLRVDGPYQHSQVATKLIETAVRHCWRHGDLKVVFDTHIDSQRAIALIGNSSLQYARSKNIHGKEVIEFYVDLYHDPEYRAGQSRTK